MPDFGAFLPEPRVTRPQARSGPLDGLSFAVKDLFDVEGLVTGCGTPDWAATHSVAARSAWAVRRLLDHGATLAGRTVTDEISLGLLGSNRFFGTPVNPIAPECYPGGSSSGSAVAVAAHAVDVALGSDSGGSVRVPASFLGLYGLRPTHGAIPVDGLMTQAPSFDTVGFFARDAETFERVGAVLLPAAPVKAFARLIIAEDALACCDETVAAAATSAVARIAEGFGQANRIIVAPEGLRHWNRQHCRLQHPEFAATFAPWLDAVNPRLSFEVARALALAATIPAAANAAAKLFRAEVISLIEALVGEDAVLCLPTTPALPPLRTASLSALDRAVTRIVDLTCIAGLTGLPQVSLPLARAGGQPVGISLIGPRGSDRSLLRVARLIDAA
jgi:amidase